MAQSSNCWVARLAGPIAALALLGGCQPAVTPIPPLPGEIHLGVTGGFSSLEPALAQTPAERTLHGLLYEGLLTYDQAIQPAPVLADGLPEPTSDGLVWTARCRQDVVFHNGEPFTCADVLARLESLRSNAGVITHTGVNPATLLALLERITSLTLVDDYVLTITLSEPFSYLPEALSHPAAAIIRAEGIGTGPYALASLSETEARLRANLHYRDAPLPAETVVLSTLPDEVASAERIVRLGAAYDAIDVAPGGDAPENAIFLTAPGVETIILFFDLEDPVAANIGVRRAIDMAIDRGRIADWIYDGHARPIPSFSALTDTEYAGSALDGSSVVMARETQAEAGWPDGFNMLLYVDPAAPNGEAMGEAFLHQLEALYVVGGAAPLEQALETPAFTLTVQSFPDSYAALAWLVGEDGPATDDEALRSAFADVQTASTISEREAALEIVDAYLSETLPMIWLVALDARALAHPEIDHVRVSPFGWLNIDTG